MEDSERKKRHQAQLAKQMLKVAKQHGYNKVVKPAGEWDPINEPNKALRRAARVGQLKADTKKLETMNKDSKGKSTKIKVIPKVKKGS